MANDSKDDSVLGHIDGLVKEEERLSAKQGLTDEDRNRVEKIKVELDQYWDLLGRGASPEVGLPTAHLPNIAKIPDSKPTLMHLRLILEQDALARKPTIPSGSPATLT